MTTYYKLTDQNLQTHNGFQWVVGKWEEATGDENKGLCSDAWLHCYDSPLLAVLHNPIHADIKNPRLWEVEVAGTTLDDCGLKRGFRRMRLVREIPVPIITTAQQIAYGVLCAMEVYYDSKWRQWADNWLSGKDRSQEAARTAWAAAARATAVWAAAAEAAEAAWVTTAARAVWAAAAAARAVVEAAGAASINLIKLAEKAMQY